MNKAYEQNYRFRMKIYAAGIVVAALAIAALIIRMIYDELGGKPIDLYASVAICFCIITILLYIQLRRQLKLTYELETEKAKREKLENVDKGANHAQ